MGQYRKFKFPNFYRQKQRSRENSGANFEEQTKDSKFQNEQKLLASPAAPVLETNKSPLARPCYVERLETGDLPFSRREKCSTSRVFP
jgi:hypothetical protein